MRRSDAAVLLFTLSPEAESARKTLGLDRPRRAAAVFRALLEHVSSVCARVSGADLLVASESALDLPAGAESLWQRGEDFSASLRLAVEDAFALGYERVVVIGNDAPGISETYLQSALEFLAGDGARAVIGPAEDGGYNLLGLSAACTSVFADMPWGSSDVCRLTVERLRIEGFTLRVLHALVDIDSAHDLASFLRRSQRTRSRLARLATRIRRFTAPAVSFLETVSLPGNLSSPHGIHGLRAPPRPSTSL